MPQSRSHGLVLGCREEGAKGKRAGGPFAGIAWERIRQLRGREVDSGTGREGRRPKLTGIRDPPVHSDQHPWDSCWRGVDSRRRDLRETGAIVEVADVRSTPNKREDATDKTKPETNIEANTRALPPTVRAGAHR